MQAFDFEALALTLKEHGQAHLLEHYHSLPEPLRPSFLAQLKEIDFKLVKNLYESVYLKHKDKGKQADAHYENIPLKTRKEELAARSSELDAIGLQAIAKGQVAVICLAGGQGSRLGFQFPKGMYQPGLLSKKSIFGYFADHLKSLTKLVRGKLDSPVSLATPWAIMTNSQTDSQVRQFFKSHGYFGLSLESVIFFPQQTLPALSYEGKVIVQDQGKIFLSPNGNGGVFSSLRRTGTLQRLKGRGVQYLHFIQVDNILARNAEPVGLGLHITSKQSVTSVFVKKASADEKVGVFLKVDGKPRIIEYSQMPLPIRDKLDEKGQLAHGDAYIGIYYSDLKFVEDITSGEKGQRLNQLYHIAEKKIPFLKDGVRVKPQKNNGIKFELFGFDAFEMADPFGVMEADRAQIFAAIKEPAGDNSPESARAAIGQLHKKWLSQHGVEFEDQPDGKTKLFEIEASLSYRGEGLQHLAAELKSQGKVKLPLFVK